jgi:hypothetical protein
MHEPLSPPLPPKIERPHREQNYPGYLGEGVTEMFIELKAKPGDRQAKQAGQGHVTHTGKNGHTQGFWPTPFTGTRDQNKRQPVGRNGRMEKRHGKTGHCDRG